MEIEQFRKKALRTLERYSEAIKWTKDFRFNEERQRVKDFEIKEKRKPDLTGQPKRPNTHKKQEI